MKIYSQKEGQAARVIIGLCILHVSRVIMMVMVVMVMVVIMIS